ncbi:hypothetical protein RHP47_02295 [Thermosynechococcus sp. QKsg1]|uniref:hypothetical protein n=1 Tax=unclassified Thermosynechococcus TaxID=2622553 RepID=UPI0016815762|nr:MULTISPECIES: hypothetical protein [unclassified Thermosynechococcus]WKT84162.1 hypothetical protein QYC28_02255 [Thermosynechococcus sp. HY596]WNC63296.1 hypothetical protein RHK13_02255 [Thermosynechococcus sp. HY591]WNC65856.1 hypothetical protein RHK28_02260 [Thermosynechococcus sp. HY593]WNC87170.1 hypothetical protein RHP47_02295 [Thermosynechococcus sp. QKsg1]
MPNSPTTAAPPAIEGLDGKVVFIDYFACVTAITALSLSQICYWRLLSPLLGIRRRSGGGGDRRRVYSRAVTIRQLNRTWLRVDCD